MIKLNKEVCMGCINKLHFTIGWSKWGFFDDERWKRGYVLHPVLDDWDVGVGAYEELSTSKIPDDCPYVLEHIMKNGKDDLYDLNKNKKLEIKND